MKKNITKFLALSFLLVYSCTSEKENEVSDENLMVTFQDSLSYTMGVNIGTNLPETEINQELLIEGLRDYWAKSEPRLDATTRLDILRAFTVTNSEIEREQMAAMTAEMKELSRKNKMDGQSFMQKNKMRDGIRVFQRSGIQYRVINEGFGIIPDYDDAVVVHYNGYLVDGQKFDSSYDRNKPLTIKIEQLILGWQNILQKMPVGSKWEVFIPFNLAYGEGGVRDNNNEFIVPPGATLIFEMELLEVIK